MVKAKRQGLGKMFDDQPQDKVVQTVKGKRPDREGKKTTIFHLPETAKKQLAILAIETEQTQQAILVEALNDLFQKHGKPRIA